MRKISKKGVGYVFLVLCLASLFATVVYLGIDSRKRQERMQREMEERMDERMDELTRSLEASFESRLSALSDSVGGIRSGISRLDSRYARLLEAQKRKTLDTLYKDTSVASMIAEAKDLFARKKYNQAYKSFAAIVEAQPDNAEARYYMAHALFLANPSDRDSYAEVRRNFDALTARGYSREEMTQVLERMRIEDAAAAGQSQGVPEVVTEGTTEGVTE
jgi:hypothetical protein